MSELINNSGSRKELLKHMILQLHEGIAPEEVKNRLRELMARIPYGEVVEVEQELISEGLPETEVLRLCDLHTEVLGDHIDSSGAREIPEGHPVDTFKKENRELEKVVSRLDDLYRQAGSLAETVGVMVLGQRFQALFNSLMDVDKHYRRKENLLFPFLEKYGITGPPTVMWGKHDETRGLLKGALSELSAGHIETAAQMEMAVDAKLKPASKAITDMIMKEEEILFPMTLDKLTEAEWYEIYIQTPEIGFCLYDPRATWQPEGGLPATREIDDSGTIRFSTGRFSHRELEAVLNQLPVDLTFVDKDDKVRYFSLGPERIFDRNRAILGRDVRQCHPPSSVHVVEQILADFKSGAQDSSEFWIQMGGRFIHIHYLALRDEQGSYLGTLEVTQNLTEKRALTGEQRILSYKK